MLIEDEALGLNRISTTTPVPANAQLEDDGLSPTDSELSGSEFDIDADELASTLARDLKDFKLDSNNITCQELEKCDSITIRPLNVVEKKSDDDELPYGMAKKGRNKKAKKKSKSGTGTPREGEEEDEARTNESVAPAVEPAEDEKLPTAKRSRRAKKGTVTDTPSSRIISLGPMGGGDELATTAIKNGDRKLDEDDGSKEMSKKDKRRAKEAAKQSIVDELVSAIPPSP